MSARRNYPTELREQVRARHAVGDITFGALAELFALPLTTVQRMVKHEYADARVVSTSRAARARRVSALGGESIRRQHVEQRPPAGVVAQAIAERSSGKPLVVETLEQKLEKAIPGAFIEDAGPRARSLSRWRVCRDALLIESGASKREAVDKAIALWGSR